MVWLNDLGGGFSLCSRRNNNNDKLICEVMNTKNSLVMVRY
jgi:hypothetical protein